MSEVIDTGEENDMRPIFGFAITFPLVGALYWYALRHPHVEAIMNRIYFAGSNFILLKWVYERAKSILTRSIR